MKKLLMLFLIVMLMLLSCGKKGNKNELTFVIWDRQQEPAMSAIAREFEKENPGIKIKVQVIGWNEYWTKLEASATGGALPDIFWMHSTKFYDYASNNMLLEVDKNIDNGFKHYPEQLVKLYQFEGKQYAVPKDYDTIGVFYNKELFDKAGVPYPDGTWDWAEFLEVAKKLTKDGVYGFAAPLNVQEGFWNTMYQNDGYVLKDNKSGYDIQASQEAIQWWVDLSLKEKVSPTQKDFDEVEPFSMFTSEKVAMIQLGSWMVGGIEENPEFAKKIGVTYLPKGKKQATIYNGLAYAAAANTKNPEMVKKFLEFLASEKANRIQSEKVAAIPAYEGTQQAWIDHNKNMDLKVLVDQIKFGVIFPMSKEGAKWRVWEEEIFASMFSGRVTVKDATTEYADKMNRLMKEEK